MLQQLLLVFHVLIAVALIALILLQQGKGAEMGAAFGSGASQTLFGSQGSGSFLFKITGLLAFLFFATSLILGYMVSHQTKQDPLQHLQKLSSELAKTAPAAAKNTVNPLVPKAGIPVQENSTKPDTSKSAP